MGNLFFIHVTILSAIVLYIQQIPFVLQLLSQVFVFSDQQVNVTPNDIHLEFYIEY